MSAIVVPILMVLGLMGALIAIMSYRRRNNLSLLPSLSLNIPGFLRPRKFANQPDATDATSTASTLNLANNSELTPNETNNSNIVIIDTYTFLGLF